MSRYLVFVLLALATGCTCGKVGADNEDPTEAPDASGPQACVQNDECPFGQVCEGGVCTGAPDSGIAADASGCTKDSDCPDLRYACAKSTGVCELVRGRCIDITDCGQEEICETASHSCVSVAADAGTTPTCLEGDQRSCGKSKVGECRYGTQTCAGTAWGPCVNAVDPQPEVCDHKDNDCDGVLDEDFDLQKDPQNCGDCGLKCAFPHATPLCDMGACRMGPCDPGFFDLNGDPKDGCEYACSPTNGGVEICDFIDNDCNGKTDEGFDQDSDGVTTCGGDCDDTNAAVKPGATELCNGLDDNCDGRKDEGFDADMDGFTTCGGDCNDLVAAIHPGAKETCNGKDDDCNGQTDENQGQTTCGTGECQHTVQNCQNGQAVTCLPLAPSTEICDGKDNDCDGETDENLGQQTCGQGVCKVTVDNCANGKPQTCTPLSSGGRTETCGNGIDDNCDGQVDENPPCTCTVGDTQPCFTGTSGTGCTFNATTKTYSCVGACKAGVQTCALVNGVPGWGTCQGSVLPSTEICDSKDNDCNGQTDENLGQSTCGVGECRRTVQNCQNGQSVTCTPLPSSAEICDGKDNDCDGNVDNGLGTKTCGVGECQRTVQACVGGVPQTCTPGAKGTEVCDNKDNDCDGTVDNGLGTATCGVGACARTVQTCQNGQTVSCVPGAATAETCNGKDDNCNGTVDDVSPASTTCGVGACQVTVQSCVGGVSQTCTPKPSSAEVCDGVDNDCNGSVDDNIGSASCSTGNKGICAAGHTACRAAATACDQDVQPVAEICGNQLDDDCNGIVDDPGPCGCNSSIDADKDGYNECKDCDDRDGAIHPGVAELCDGKDNNCDKQIDEGFDKDLDGYTTCGTKPGGGLDPTRVDCDDAAKTTNPGVTCDCAAGCTISPASGLTAGDGKDNNCNGTVDETCNCSTLDRDGDGQTGCGGDCNDADKTVYAGAPEICDGKDNDCNKKSVENCDVGQTCTPGGTGPDVCKNRLVCATDITSGKATCGSFCNFSRPGLGLGDGCRSGESCSASLILSDNDHLCTASGTIGTKLAGDACKGDTECKSNSCLPIQGKSGYCTDLCGNDADYCSASSSCIVRDIPSSSVMNPEYEFMTGNCFPNVLTSYVGTKTTGQACNAAASLPECKYGDLSCVNGKCAAPCCKNADCPGGYFCNADGISKTITSRYIAGRACTTNADCGGSNTCDTTTKTCRMGIATGVPACTPRTSAGTRVAGQACSANSDCLSQFCETTRLGGVCVDTCCSDASCANGTTCEYLMVQKPNGALENMRLCVHTPVPPRPGPGEGDLVWK